MGEIVYRARTASSSLSEPGATSIPSDMKRQPSLLFQEQCLKLKLPLDPSRGKTPDLIYLVLLKENSIKFLLNFLNFRAVTRPVTICRHTPGGFLISFCFKKIHFLDFSEFQVIKGNVSKLSNGNLLRNERADTFGCSEKSKWFFYPHNFILVSAQNSLVILGNIQFGRWFSFMRYLT